MMTVRKLEAIADILADETGKHFTPVQNAQDRSLGLALTEALEAGLAKAGSEGRIALNNGEMVDVIAETNRALLKTPTKTATLIRELNASMLTPGID